MEGVTNTTRPEPTAKLGARSNSRGLCEIRAYTGGSELVEELGGILTGELPFGVLFELVLLRFVVRS